MAIFKPSNLSPNLTEVDVRYPFDIKFEAHTAGSNISAYELKIYKEFNVEDDEDGEKSIVYKQSGNFENPLNPSENITYTNGDTVVFHVPSGTGLQNEENYRWSIRVYQDMIEATPTSASYVATIPTVGDYAANLIRLNNNSIVPTYVGEDMIVGSTRDVIWSPDYDYNMKINNCVECRFNSFNSDFNIFEKDDNNIRPTYWSCAATDVSSISDIYGQNTGTIRCLKIDDGIIDKKHFEELTNKQYYLLISTTPSFADTFTVQIQDIIKYDNSFWFVPYNQSFIRSTPSGASIIRNDRYAPFAQDMLLPTSGTFYYTIECRQRQMVNDLYKNVGEQNLTEMLFDSPFEYSYSGVSASEQKAGIYSSLGLQSELIEDKNETRDKNIILKTIYIKPNLRGSNTLTPVGGSGPSISGGWILSGSEDASYGSLNSLNPINCFIKFGNFISGNPTLEASDYKGQIVNTGASSNQFYISLPSDTSSSQYQWKRYDECTLKQIVGDTNQQPGFFNVQAYNLQDGQLIIKVPESFYVNTDQFYTFYYVSSPLPTSSTEYAYFLDSGVIGGGEWNGSNRKINNSFEVFGYNITPTSITTVSGTDYYYYNLFLAPNNGLKPDPYRPVYLKIQNDDTQIEGLVINSGAYDRDLSVDKMDKTQYLCQFLTTVSSDDPAITDYDIFQPQTKVKISTQFVDSVPQQYFYARAPLSYGVDIYDITGTTSAVSEGLINQRDVQLNGHQITENETSNQIKYYRYQIYQLDNNELLYDSGNIYNTSLKYIVRGLPNWTGIEIVFSWEDNLGKSDSTTLHYTVQYPSQDILNQINVKSDCQLHANKIGLSANSTEVLPTRFSGAQMDTENKEIDISIGGEVLYKKVNDSVDININNNSTILAQIQFGYDLLNPSDGGVGGLGVDLMTFTVNSENSEETYRLAIDNKIIDYRSGKFSIHNDYRHFLFTTPSSSTSITLSTDDLTSLDGFVFMVSDTSDAYSSKIPMILVSTAQISGDITCPTTCISGSDFIIPSDYSNMFIVDPDSAFHESKIPQNTYNVLITTTTSASCSITKITTSE